MMPATVSDHLALVLAHRVDCRQAARRLGERRVGAIAQVESASKAVGVGGGKRRRSALDDLVLIGELASDAQLRGREAPMLLRRLKVGEVLALLWRHLGAQLDDRPRRLARFSRRFVGALGARCCLGARRRFTAPSVGRFSDRCRLASSSGGRFSNCRRLAVESRRRRRPSRRCRRCSRRRRRSSGRCFACCRGEGATSFCGRVALDGRLRFCCRLKALGLTSRCSLVLELRFELRHAFSEALGVVGVRSSRLRWLGDRQNCALANDHREKRRA